MEDDITEKMEDNLKKLKITTKKMEDDLKKMKWKTTSEEKFVVLKR
jgi:hypothetical protein